MENRIFTKFNNYCNVSESLKQTNPKIYYYLKTFAFRALFEFLSNTGPSEFQNQKNIFIMKYNEYIQEKKNHLEYFPKLTREEYISFLNDFFNKLNFSNKTNPEKDNVYLLRDLIEVAIDFGPLDQDNAERFETCNRFVTNYIHYSNKNNLQQQSMLMNNNLVGNLRNFRTPISIHDTQTYQQFCAEICNYIQSINNDLDSGNVEIAKNKTNIAIHYLNLVKK